MGKVNEFERRQSNGRRTYARLAEPPSEEAFLYPQEYDESAYEYEQPNSRTVNIPPPQRREPRRPRGERPMPKRLSEELEEEQFAYAEPEVPERKAPARKRTKKQA